MPQAMSATCTSAGAIEAVARLAAPQIGRAEKPLGHGDEILFPMIERRKVARRHEAERRHRKPLLLARHRELAPSGSVATGGSLIDGPGNTSVRSAITLCVGASRGASSAFAGSQPT